MNNVENKYVKKNLLLYYSDGERKQKKKKLTCGFVFIEFCFSHRMNKSHALAAKDPPKGGGRRFYF